MVYVCYTPIFVKGWKKKKETNLIWQKARNFGVVEILAA